MEDNFLKQLWEKVKQSEWGISVSVGGYLILVTIGMLFSFAYYAMFRINIFKFSDLSDFLLVPFADPFTILFLLASVVFILALAQLNNWWKAKYPKSFVSWTYWLSLGVVKEIESEKYKKREKNIYLVSLIMYIAYAAAFYGIYKRKKVLENQTYIEYKVNFESDMPVKDSLIFLGDNANYYFLHHVSQKESYIIPKDKLNYVKVKKNPNGRFF